jgi:hypothetical protein
VFNRVAKINSSMMKMTMKMKDLGTRMMTKLTRTQKRSLS